MNASASASEPGRPWRGTRRGTRRTRRASPTFASAAIGSGPLSMCTTAAAPNSASADPVRAPLAAGDLPRDHDQREAEHGGDHERGRAVGALEQVRRSRATSRRAAATAAARARRRARSATRAVAASGGRRVTGTGRAVGLGARAAASATGTGGAGAAASAGAFWPPPSCGPQRGEEDHVADRLDARDQHHQPVDADAEPAGRRQAVLERLDVVVVDGLGLLVAAGLQPRLVREALRLVDGIVELGVGVGELARRRRPARSARSASGRRGAGRASGEISRGWSITNVGSISFASHVSS